MKQAATNLLASLLSGYVLFFFSERLFWSVWKPGDAVLELVVTWLAYSAITYLFLSVVSWFRVRDPWAVFLAAAIYGWLTEGGLVPTLYGTEGSAPFPVSLSITGLSWHALISVMVGWYATGRALGAGRPAAIIAISTGVGVFWGVWATFLWRENPPVVTSVPAFLANATALTGLLALAWYLMRRLGAGAVRPGWVGILFCVALLAVFYSQHVLRLGLLPVVVFPAVLAAALIPLARSRRVQPALGASLWPEAPASSNLVWLGLIPGVATLTYAMAGVVGLERVNVAGIVYFWVTGPLGFALFVWAMIRCLRARPAA